MRRRKRIRKFSFFFASYEKQTSLQPNPPKRREANALEQQMSPNRLQQMGTTTAKQGSNQTIHRTEVQAPTGYESVTRNKAAAKNAKDTLTCRWPKMTLMGMVITFFTLLGGMVAFVFLADHGGLSEG